MPSNRWADIYRHLESKGFDVYPPSRHKGECTSRYIVLKIDQSMQVGTFSSVSQSYDILLYIPNDEYSQLEDFVADFKTAMKELEPMIMPEHYQTPAYYDESVNGHMVSIRYRNSRKL